MKTKFMRIFRMLHNPAKQLRYRESWNGGQSVTCLRCYCQCCRA